MRFADAVRKVRWEIRLIHSQCAAVERSAAALKVGRAADGFPGSEVRDARCAALGIRLQTCHVFLSRTKHFQSARTARVQRGVDAAQQ